jgi:hypothetical protein
MSYHLNTNPAKKPLSLCPAISKLNYIDNLIIYDYEQRVMFIYHFRQFQSGINRIMTRFRSGLKKFKDKDIMSTIKLIPLPFDITNIVISFLFPASTHKIKLYQPVKLNRIVETFQTRFQVFQRMKELLDLGYRVWNYERDREYQLRYWK